MEYIKATKSDTEEILIIRNTLQNTICYFMKTKDFSSNRQRSLKYAAVHP